MASSFTGYVSTEAQATTLFHFARCQYVALVHRLDTREQKRISPGSGYIYHVALSGIKRWTDGRKWEDDAHPAGCIRIYREIPDAKSSFTAYNGFKKKSIWENAAGHTLGDQLRIVVYFQDDDDDEGKSQCDPIKMPCEHSPTGKVYIFPSGKCTIDPSADSTVFPLPPLPKGNGMPVEASSAAISNQLSASSLPNVCSKASNKSLAPPSVQDDSVSNAFAQAVHTAQLLQLQQRQQLETQQMERMLLLQQRQLQLHSLPQLSTPAQATALPPFDQTQLQFLQLKQQQQQLLQQHHQQQLMQQLQQNLQYSVPPLAQPLLSQKPSVTSMSFTSSPSPPAIPLDMSSMTRLTNAPTTLSIPSTENDNDSVHSGHTSPMCSSSSVPLSNFTPISSAPSTWKSASSPSLNFTANLNMYSMFHPQMFQHTHPDFEHSMNKRMRLDHFPMPQFAAPL